MEFGKVQIARKTWADLIKSTPAPDSSPRDSSPSNHESEWTVVGAPKATTPNSNPSSSKPKDNSKPNHKAKDNSKPKDNSNSNSNKAKDNSKSKPKDGSIKNTADPKPKGEKPSTAANPASKEKPTAPENQKRGRPKPTDVVTLDLFFSQLASKQPSKRAMSVPVSKKEKKPTPAAAANPNKIRTTGKKGRGIAKTTRTKKRGLTLMKKMILDERRKHREERKRNMVSMSEGCALSSESSSGSASCSSTTSSSSTNSASHSQAKAAAPAADLLLLQPSAPSTEPPPQPPAKKFTFNIGAAAFVPSWEQPSSNPQQPQQPLQQPPKAKAKKGPAQQGPKFRDFCKQVQSVELDEAVLHFLRELRKTQIAAIRKAQSQGKPVKLRYVVGLRQSLKHLKAHKVVLMIMPPNIPDYEALNGYIDKIIAQCNEQDVPLAFASTMKRLPQALEVVTATAVAVIFAEPLYEELRRIKELTADARAKYAEEHKNDPPPAKPETSTSSQTAHSPDIIVQSELIPRKAPPPKKSKKTRKINPDDPDDYDSLGEYTLRS